MNGDIVVVNNSSSNNHGKKYLCINKVDNPSTNLTDAFIELNTKDGSVISINGKSGSVNLTLDATDDKVKLNIGSGSDTTTTEIPVITEAEINSIIESLN